MKQAVLVSHSNYTLLPLVFFSKYGSSLLFLETQHTFILSSIFLLAFIFFIVHQLANLPVQTHGICYLRQP